MIIEARFVIREGCGDIREASNGIPAVYGGIQGESRDDLPQSTSILRR